MQTAKINVSQNFKKKASNAILSIGFFIVVYLVLIVLAALLTIMCAYLGFNIITVKINFLTLVLGAGLIVLGALVFIFLIKFIFTKNTADLSHLTEVSREEQPALYKLVDEIVQKAETDSPKKIFLSPDVNASVFYDSSFWSMFLPVRKNLQIGMGLVNSVTVNEFKAIIAHEFGHFSQRSMKVGSYVYNVNRIIYNMLYENDSYSRLAGSISGITDSLTFFVGIAMKINQGIQYILRQVYGVVNKSYMALSREMEFHADEVAANIAGSEPLATSLLRLDLADEAYNRVIDYYNNKIKENIKTENLYPQQKFVLDYLGKDVDLAFKHGFPSVTKEFQNRFNRSKLVITNQWASHPSNEDRIAALEKLNLPIPVDDNRPARELFQNVEHVQQQTTEKILQQCSKRAI